MIPEGFTMPFVDIQSRESNTPTLIIDTDAPVMIMVIIPAKGHRHVYSDIRMMPVIILIDWMRPVVVHVHINIVVWIPVALVWIPTAVVRIPVALV